VNTRLEGAYDKAVLRIDSRCHIDMLWGLIEDGVPDSVLAKRIWCVNSSLYITRTSCNTGRGLDARRLFILTDRLVFPSYRMGRGVNRRKMTTIKQVDRPLFFCGK
jgi:hypothetical protein